MSDQVFQIEVDKSALIILNKAVKKYLETWPGGSPVEQESIRQMKVELDRALLHLSFYSGDDVE
tara:strand:+ start:146 stop:337 length:192 start_codon:yes stop_codon:yes gene_type:complete